MLTLNFKCWCWVIHESCQKSKSHNFFNPCVWQEESLGFAGKLHHMYAWSDPPFMQQLSWGTPLAPTPNCEVCGVINFNNESATEICYVVCTVKALCQVNLVSCRRQSFIEERTTLHDEQLSDCLSTSRYTNVKDVQRVVEHDQRLKQNPLSAAT